MANAWRIVMTWVMELLHDKLVEYFDDNGMDYCDENGIRHSDENRMEAFVDRV